VQTRSAEKLAQIVIILRGGFRLSVAKGQKQIVPYAALYHYRQLLQQSKPASKSPRGNIVVWNAVEQQFTRTGNFEAAEQAQEGGFAAARFSAQYRVSALLNVEVKTGDQRRRPVGEYDVSEFEHLFGGSSAISGESSPYAIRSRQPHET